MKSKNSKKALRNFFLNKRISLSDETHEKKSFEITNHCLKLPIWNKDYFHLFLPIKRKAEINTTLILTLLQGRDKQIVLPRIKGTRLENILLTDSTRLRINNWGIPEPERGLIIDPKQIEVIFIPLLIFDKKGNRLGYGKGFYDQFLSFCNPEVLKIGLSFFEAIEEIEGVRLNDLILDYCVTPNGIKMFKTK